MFFWNSLAFLMIQKMLAIWSLAPLPCLKPAWTSGSSRFRHCRSLAWRIWGITLLACKISALQSYLKPKPFLSFRGDGFLAGDDRAQKPLMVSGDCWISAVFFWFWLSIWYQAIAMETLQYWASPFCNSSFYNKMKEDRWLCGCSCLMAFKKNYVSTHVYLWRIHLDIWQN